MGKPPARDRIAEQHPTPGRRCPTQAVRVGAFGGPEVLTPAEVPDPVVGPGHVLVRLRRREPLRDIHPLRRLLPELPYIPGADGAGDVVSCGPGVDGYSAGQRVYVAGAPTYAQLVAAPAEAVWPLPAALRFEQGAAVGVPDHTAYLALGAAGASGSAPPTAATWWPRPAPPWAGR